MEHIVLEFGMGFLQIVAVVLMVVVFVSFCESGGVIYNAVSNYMTSICG